LKILIIDDEKLSREGLLHNIDWDSLRINEVILAEDGQKGITLAQQHCPEIILSDIRMPHMNGIQMAEKIHEILPDTCIIFISGYSDKEYLKAAIKLKAIRYVEKPIEQKEIEDALREAVQQIEIAKHSRHAELSHQREQSSQLALTIIQKEGLDASKEILTLTRSLNLTIKENTYFTTCLVEFQTPISTLSSQALGTLLQEVSQMLAKLELSEIYAYKNDRYLILHIYGMKKPSDAILEKCCTYLQTHLSAFCNFFIAMGKTVCGIRQVYQSYISAAILLQSSFFREYNEILTDNEQKTDSQLLKDQILPFSMALSEKNIQKARQIIDGLFADLRNCQTLLQGQVKDIYYQYFMQIQNYLTTNQIWTTEQNQATESIWESISRCPTLKELHTMLCHKLEMLSESLENATLESSLVFQIKSFICKNYSIDSLSVKDIGEHVYLSPSYVCTLFKNETGVTLNQYLTEYRIEMAKQLLCDKQYKIADISSKVGYSDSSYFGKAFKKSIGLSPTEYREKMMK